MIKVLVLTVTMLFFGFDALVLGSHYKGAEITYESAGYHTYLFTVRTYTTSSTSIDLSYIYVDWGEGQIDSLERLETHPSDFSWNGQQNVYKGTHFYPLEGQYEIKFTAQGRETGIINIPGSQNEGFCVTSTVIVSPFFQNNSVWFSDFPCPLFGCTTEIFNYTVPVFDNDGDSISSELIVCADESCLPIGGYTYPNLLGGTFIYDDVTKTITWDTPVTQGEYNIAIKFHEWKIIGQGQPIEIATVIRDFQITIIADCTSVGMKEDEKDEGDSEFSIFPNPNNGEFKLNFFDENNLILITIYDVSGKIVLEKNLSGIINKRTANFEIPNADPGLYLISVETEKGIKSAKFIVE